MRQLKSTEELRAAILELQAKRTEEATMMKERLHQTIEGLKPANLLKSAVHEVQSSPQLQDQLLTTGVALSAGQLSKFMFQRTSNSPFKRLIGAAIMLGVTNVIAQNPQVVKNIGLVLVNLVKKRAEKRAERKRLRAAEQDSE